MNIYVLVQEYQLDSGEHSIITDCYPTEGLAMKALKKELEAIIEEIKDNDGEIDCMESDNYEGYVRDTSNNLYSFSIQANTLIETV